ncbi:hypothetical protein BC827DRAFT_1171623 [Russula dissimulans]|nr:hypothetical protein BC827DRAFT_1171623 [Russula dissimulans]
MEQQAYPRRRLLPLHPVSTQNVSPALTLPVVHAPNRPNNISPVLTVPITSPAIDVSPCTTPPITHPSQHVSLLLTVPITGPAAVPNINMFLGCKGGVLHRSQCHDDATATSMANRGPEEVVDNSLGSNTLTDDYQVHGDITQLIPCPEEAMRHAPYISASGAAFNTDKAEGVFNCNADQYTTLSKDRH